MSTGGDKALRAVQAARLNWAETPDDVWGGGIEHVSGLQADAERALVDALEDAWRSDGPSPIGLALTGARGAGKTHLLGWLRAAVQGGGGYFFLVQLLSGGDFWRSALQGVVDGLLRPHDVANARTDQLTHLLVQLGTRAGVTDSVTAMLRGKAPVTRDQLDAFLTAALARDRRDVMEAQDTLRALALYASADDRNAQETGRAFLSLGGHVDEESAASWGLRDHERDPQLILRDLSRLMALTGGPVVMAVDQIDTLFAQAGRGADRSVAERTEVPAQSVDGVVNSVADGLMALRETTRRTLSVVTCLPVSWRLIEDRAGDTVADRFRKITLASRQPSAQLAASLVAAHLAPGYRRVGHAPPYPTWPISLAAFDSALDHSPRTLLQQVDSHLRRCVDGGSVVELTSWDLADSQQTQADEAGAIVSRPDMAALDEQLEELKAAAEVADLLAPRNEDHVVPRLLSALFSAMKVELGAAGGVLSVDPPPPARVPPIHARLRREVDPETEKEDHWAFRSVLVRDSRSVIAKIRHAREAADMGSFSRHLILLRRDDWPTSKVARQKVEEFQAAGGLLDTFADDDVRTADALYWLLREHPPGLESWLRERRPAGATALVRTHLHDLLPVAPAPSDTTAPPGQPADPPEPWSSQSLAPATADQVPLGTSLVTSRDFDVPLASLRKHAVVFAGSGSGKTVFLRRLVEECALQGVSAIVLDPNNDLARLGDPWPQRPPSWRNSDAAKAAEYLACVDVVVWTPNREAGRPLSFRPLPDFAPVIDDPDEFRDALDAAVASLEPRARTAWTLKSAQQGRAVLTEVLRHFAREGWSTLPELIDLLTDVPEGVTSISRGRRLAHDTADALKAAMINDPLFGGDGQAVDPGVLLTAAPGKRARVSVISFIGLPRDEQRHSFVNQLQMALFSWIKANPATDLPLGSLLVMDEAAIYAPSRGVTASSTSTYVLAAQARKYGLGLVLATQAPKDLDNRISGNASTQLVGHLNSPVQIDAARQVAKNRGGDVPDIARLVTGEFYVGVEGRAFERLRTPLCLTHHPPTPLTTEEVIARALRGSEPA